MKSAKIFFLCLVALLLFSGVLLAKRISGSTKSGFAAFEPIVAEFKQWQSQNPDLFTLNFSRWFFVEDVKPTSPSASSKPTPSPSLTPTPAPTIKPRASTPPKATTPPKTCYKSTVPHLDGSSSTRCYTQSDAQALQSLSSQFASAQSSYRFYQSVADSYYESADKFNSDFFRKAGDEAAVKAKAEQQKMGEISLQMYTIEERGW